MSAYVQIGHLLPRLSQQRVLIVGDLMLDEYIIGESSRMSAEAPVPIVQFNRQRAVLGGAANTAANVATMGAQVTLIGMLDPGDAAGRELVQICETTGIRLFPIRDGRPTTRKVRVIGQDQQLLRLDYEHVAYIDREAEARILSEFSQQVLRADIVVVSDYAKGLLTASLCQAMVADAHAAGKQIVVDPRPQHASFYLGCDYMTPNWKESQGLLGEPETSPTDEAVARTGARLTEQFRSNVLLTLGARGIAFFGREPHERFFVPAASKEVFDVSGAGDTVVAAFALATAAGCVHRDAVGLANRAAGIVVAKRGTATVTIEELLAFEDGTPRLLERDTLRGFCSLLQAKGKRVVTVTGAFDLLHAGHLYFLNQAKQQGDVLIVGLKSDTVVRGHKGTGRPLVPQAQRAELLLALRAVDYVHIIDEPMPVAFLEAVRPNVHVKGSALGDAELEAAAVTKHGGRFEVVERLAGLFGAAMIERT